MKVPDQFSTLTNPSDDPVLQSGSRAVEPADLPGAQELLRKARARIKNHPDEFIDGITRSLFDGLLERYAGLVRAAQQESDEQALADLAFVDHSALEEDSVEEQLGAVDFEAWRENHPSAPLYETVEEWVNPGGNADQLASWALFLAFRELDQHLLEEGVVLPMTPRIQRDRKLEELFGTDDSVKGLLQRLSTSLAGGILKGLRDQEDESLSPIRIERLLGVSGKSAPSPRPEARQYAPIPFTGEPPMAEVLSDPFTERLLRALRDADEDPSASHEEEWGKDETGHPIRVEQLENPYDGKVTFRVQAFGEPDPAAIEASMGWNMLGQMDMDTIWLHLYLLAYASASHRRGDRSVIQIPRRRVEKVVFGFRHRNKTVEQRAREIKKHVEALQSIFVRFQNVERHGDKLQFGGDLSATPLWNLQMRAEGEKDFFTGDVKADWHLKVREGIWAEKFLHEYGDQWTPLSKEWFEKIDRRGEPFAQRLAVYLLLQFRINEKNGYQVKASVKTLLDACGEDLKRKDNAKRKFSEVLDTLKENYGIVVHDKEVHIDHTWRLDYDQWKSRSVVFEPPQAMDRRLFGDSEEKSPPLPEVDGNWKAEQIRSLRTEVLEETQSDFGNRFGVTKQYISQLENGHKAPSASFRKKLDRLRARFEE